MASTRATVRVAVGAAPRLLRRGAWRQAERAHQGHGERPARRRSILQVVGLGEKLKAYNLQDLGNDTVEANLLLRHPADAQLRPGHAMLPRPGARARCALDK